MNGVSIVLAFVLGVLFVFLVFGVINFLIQDVDECPEKECVMIENRDSNMVCFRSERGTKLCTPCDFKSGDCYKMIKRYAQWHSDVWIDYERRCV